jgi:hypothetical protein
VATSSLLLVNPPIKRLWCPGNRLFDEISSMFKNFGRSGKFGWQFLAFAASKHKNLKRSKKYRHPHGGQRWIKQTSLDWLERA